MAPCLLPGQCFFHNFIKILQVYKIGYNNNVNGYTNDNKDHNDSICISYCINSYTQGAIAERKALIVYKNWTFDTFEMSNGFDYDGWRIEKL